MMRARRRIPCAVVCMLFALAWSAGSSQAALTAKEQLGKLLFFDTTLSHPDGQACASCHDPSTGYADPIQNSPVSKGVVTGRFGKRNAPSAAYCGFGPDFVQTLPAVVRPAKDRRNRSNVSGASGMYVGGHYWDGRAATLEHQAQGPFLDPLEMNNPDIEHVVDDVQGSAYAGLFTQVYGPDIFANPSQAYRMIADAIAAFERSPEASPFSSKFDRVLAGRATFTPMEIFGRWVFEEKAHCSGCHPSESGPGGTPPLFSDFGYANLGVPRNPDNPFYTLPPELNPEGEAWVDCGLGGAFGLPAEMGKMKVPTLRNVALTAPYMHNGYFATLRDVVEFLNTRDAELSPWAAPEVPQNVNVSDVGDLKLSELEVSALVTFLKTLTDGDPPANDKRWVEPSMLPDGHNRSIMTISPNPFNPATRIEYTVNSGSAVRVAVYDVSGRLVRRLVDDTRAPGVHATTWDGRDARGVSVASGIYFVRMETNRQTVTKKAVLAR